MSPSNISDDLSANKPSHGVKEEQIEYGFIGKLQGLKYEYRPDIRDRAALERNFREKFEALNRVHLTDGEFARLLDDIVTPDVFTAAKTLRSINAFTREDGTPLNYTLVNIKDWCKNTFEVVNQLRINTDNSHHRYDVLILINGVPCVQIELKTLGINPRRAMEQIVDYKNDPGNGYTKTLLGFLQLFIVSNRTNTYYFANNNARHFAFNVDERFLPIYQFADEANKKITQLDEFADKFLPKCTLGQTISRYMVLVASEQKLLMMRPYQVYAVKRVVECIAQNNGNGYIWHTTGSGKTLTSFKASTLLKDNPDVEKCLFVVDRKDLDRQTREEFNRFQEGCVEENTNTATLVRRLLSCDYADKVIVTTIQKLGLALDENSKRNKQQKKDGKATRQVQRPVTLYHLDAILAVGYRVRSPRGVQFRRWASTVLKEYLVKGFVMDDERLKNPDGRLDYFDEMLARIRDIRASEKRFYQKVRDLFALAADYDKTDEATQTFFATVQNLLLYAVTQKTAAELIVSRANPVRFKSHGLAPKSAADFAFLLHGFHFLKDEGVMAIILPHGVLFRGGAEERIRTKLLKDGHIDTVIGLPSNLFYSTGIPVCILVLKKCKKPDDVLFINAAEHFAKGKRQNQLTDEHIAKIIKTYQFREEEARYSRRVDMAEIEKNDFNLNISRYISTAVGEAEIDLTATHGELVEIEKAIAAAKEKHNGFLKELGLSPLP